MSTFGANYHGLEILGEDYLCNSCLCGIKLSDWWIEHKIPNLNREVLTGRCKLEGIFLWEESELSNNTAMSFENMSLKTFLDIIYLNLTVRCPHC